MGKDNFSQIQGINVGGFTGITSDNFMSVDHSKGFFGELDHIINYVKLLPEVNRKDLLRTLENTKRQGFKLQYHFTFQEFVELGKKYNCRVEELPLPIVLFYPDDRSFLKPFNGNIENKISTTCQVAGVPIDSKFTFEDFLVKNKNSIIGVFLNYGELIWENLDGVEGTNGIRVVIIKKESFMERREVYQAIDGERNYQDKKWSGRNATDGIPDEEKPVSEWVNYIEFHLERAKSCVYYLNKDGALDELRKVAALAVRAMEIHGCPLRQSEVDESIVTTSVTSITTTTNCCNNGTCDCKK